MPNLVLQNGDSYVSAKLTIRSSEGLVEIEHEHIKVIEFIEFI